MAYDAFENLHKFQDDVWGQIRLNDVERDIIDTPEYQRLFRTSQLGFVELVYHTANHTRGAHSIGACRITNRLIDRLVDNTKDLFNKFHDYPGCEELYADFKISLAERALIRLGALLHDVSHVPLSHDLERKSHKIIYPSQEKPLKLRSWYGHYEKHDDWEDNPLLFRLLCDHESSVLARALRHYSAAFWDLLKKDASQPEHRHLKQFVDLVGGNHDADWKPDADLLPQLVFHLLFYEKQEEAEDAARKILTDFGNTCPEAWHLGPKSLTDAEIWKWHDAWYQPFRHDIIGNTLSADLIDYLTRDPQRLGTPRRVDLHLLSYYALVRLVNPGTKSSEKKYRCAIDLHDHKRGTTRTFLLNDLFRLLDLRQDIHEKAVVHRVVQSANAMLARGLLLLGKEGMPGEDKRPKLKEIAGLGENNRGKKQQHALQSEDLLFHQLLEICSGQTERRFVEARRIFEKLTERRVCRPLVIIPGDWAYEKLSLVKPQDSDPDFPLRTLAAIVDSAYYSPFLLFVCSCVEKYLEGIFDTDAELCSYANKIGIGEASPHVIEKARNLIPSRVIVWTAPYKQLYKDPAIVVALEKCVGQIDSVIDRAKFPSINLDKSTRERIETAIGDADSKYATLWQLYVFISDGLFYSGILNKLLKGLPAECSSGKVRDDHEVRLKNAQAFLPLAFKTVCNDWHGVDQRHTKVEDKQKTLNQRMAAKDFQEVVGAWAAACKHKNSWPPSWSTVDIKQYYHECAHEGEVLNEKQRPCRDSRYKFDKFATAVWKQAAANASSPGFKLIQFLEKCRIYDPKAVSEGEFNQLAALYEDEETRRRCNILVKEAETDATQIPAALKALFASGFPMLEIRKETSGKEAVQSSTDGWIEEEEIRSMLKRFQPASIGDDVLKSNEIVMERFARKLRDRFSPQQHSRFRKLISEIKDAVHPERNRLFTPEDIESGLEFLAKQIEESTVDET